MSNKQSQFNEILWNYTVANSDLYGTKFHKILEICKDFIDAHEGKFNQALYSDLQDSLQQNIPVTGNGWDATQRKRINQLVKLGFIFPYLRGYPKEVLDFLNSENDIQKKKKVLSKVIHKYANFQNTVTKNNELWDGHVDFLIRTLKECKVLTNYEIIALMTYNYPLREKEFLSHSDVVELAEKMNSSGVLGRKYTQGVHFINLLSKLDNISLSNGKIYFENNAKTCLYDEEEL